MKKFGLPTLGISLYVIVTMIDIFVVSLPLSMYVLVLAMGALLIALYFLGGLLKDSKVSAEDSFKPAVFHIRRHPMI